VNDTLTTHPHLIRAFGQVLLAIGTPTELEALQHTIDDRAPG